MKRNIVAGALVVAATGCLLSAGSAASATPPTGNQGLPSAAPAVVGELDGRTRAKQDGIALKVRRDTTVRTFTLTYPIGSSSEWHSHPGIVLATVQQGTVIRQVGCRAVKFTEGESFTEAAPHRVSNAYRRAGQQGAVPAVLSITQLLPADAPETRIDKPAPRCS